MEETQLLQLYTLELIVGLKIKTRSLVPNRDCRELHKIKNKLESSLANMLNEDFNL